MLAGRKLVMLLFMVVFICICESRRGGGGGGGGYRGGGYRGGGYRSSRSSRSSSSSSRYGSRLSRAVNARGWSSRSKTIAMRAGSIYVASRLHRIHYRDDSDSYDSSFLNMDICRNVYKYPRANSTQKVYGWFLCPTGRYQDHEKFCCGSEDAEYCCGYWKTGDGIRDIVLWVIGGTVALVILVYFLCKNPGIINCILEALAVVLCCPCHVISKSCRKMQNRIRNRREARRRRARAERELDEQHIRVSKKDDETVDVPPPPSYDTCVRKNSLNDIEVDFDDDKPRMTECGPENGLPYPLGPPVDPVIPCAPPSPPSYRSPSPPRYRSPSPHHYRSSSPVGGRSSPARHSISSNRS